MTSLGLGSLFCGGSPPSQATCQLKRQPHLQVLHHVNLIGGIWKNTAEVNFKMKVVVSPSFSRGGGGGKGGKRQGDLPRRKSLRSPPRRRGCSGPLSTPEALPRGWLSGCSTWAFALVLGLGLGRGRRDDGFRSPPSVQAMSLIFLLL